MAGDELEYPRPEARDKIRGLVEAFTQFHPATAAGARLMQDLITPSLELRRTAFFDAVAAGLARLNTEMRDLGAQLAAHEDQFVTIATLAATTATRTVEDEKLKRLRNAALNAAVRDLDMTLAEMFMRAIDEMGSLHMQVLVYLSDPAAALRDAGLDPEQFERGPRPAAFKAAFPGIGTLPIELGGVVMRDLYSRGFVLIGELDHAPHQAIKVTAPLTTDLGLTFLAFVDPPWEDAR